MLFQSWTTHRSVSAWGGEHALNKLLSVCWCLHMQRQIDAERKRQQVKKVASAKLEKLLTKKAEVRHLLLILLPSHPSTASPSSLHTASPPPPLTFLQLQRNKNELEGTMRKVFSSVFVHRYRDVRPEIRALCIAELGSWMMEYRYAE